MTQRVQNIGSLTLQEPEHIDTYRDDVQKFLYRVDITQSLWEDPNFPGCFWCGSNPISTDTSFGWYFMNQATGQALYDDTGFQSQEFTPLCGGCVNRANDALANHKPILEFEVSYSAIYEYERTVTVRATTEKEAEELVSRHDQYQYLNEVFEYGSITDRYINNVEAIEA